MLSDLITATWAHLLNGLFLGLVPVVACALGAGGAVWLGCYAAKVPQRVALARFAVFFGIVGGALGLLLGASREPALKAFLPALLTALSGLFIYLFPREVKEGRIALSVRKGDDTPALVRAFVLAGVAALMLSATMGSFWGGSIRGLKEQGDRRYAEWKAEYEAIELPLRLKVLTDQLNAGAGEGETEAAAE